MDKVKIQEIADEAELSNGDLLNKAKELGFNVKAVNSTMSMEDAGILVEYAISGTLPKNWKKIRSKKLKTTHKSSIDITYESPKKTKWAGVTIVGKKIISETTETEKAKNQRKQGSRKASSAETPKKKKSTKKSETSESLKKLLDSFGDSQLEDTQKYTEITPKKNYTPSEKLALKKGFSEVTDPNAYNGRYFIKNREIWIHDISALKVRLGVLTDQEVRSHGYDVDTYYDENKYKNKRSLPKSLRMCDTKDRNDQCHYSLSDMVYMSDGMYIHKDDCWW